MPGKVKQPGGKVHLLDRLATLASGLPDQAQRSLLEFAEFLSHKYPVENQATEPALVPIERPPKETVIAAIRRLTKTYPMLEKEVLFQQTSQAMSDHVLQSVSVKESIDRLEAVFRKEYENWLEKHRD